MQLNPDPSVAPACLGQWELFDSVKPADHERAAELCAGCPTFALCELSLAHENVRHVTGTWAGRLFNAYTQTGQVHYDLTSQGA